MYKVFTTFIVSLLAFSLNANANISNNISAQNGVVKQTISTVTLTSPNPTNSKQKSALSPSKSQSKIKPQVKSQIKLLSSSKQKISSAKSSLNDLGYVVKNVPATLSKSDVKLYRKMFKLQRQRQRTRVAGMVSELENRSLMGHLIAIRLLHPNQRASYTDLQKWLARYSEQSPSKSIYKLANKRKPKRNRVGHKKPQNMAASMARYDDPDQSFNAKRAEKKSRKRSNLLRKLKHYRVKQYYTKSSRILMKNSTINLLGKETWQSATTKLARAMVNDSYHAKAERLMRFVISNSAVAHPEALWLAGFSAYNQGKYTTATNNFRRLAYNVPKRSKYYAKGAWWAAKSYEKTQQPSMAKIYYKMASNDQLSFYGQMAVEKIGKVKTGSWEGPQIKVKDQKFLFSNQTIKRVIALVQIGEYGLAQQELKMVYDKIPYDMDESLLALSIRLQLPNTAMTLAMNLQERGKVYLNGLYPESKVWQPRDGYKLDKAVLNSIVRQESAFNPYIISRAGARGLLQVMPATAKYIRRNQNRPIYPKHKLLAPSVSLTLGQDYLTYLGDKLEGNMLHMIASYNAGPGNVQKWVKSGMGKGDPLLFIESIPFKETRKYVKKVMANMWMYRERYGQPAPGLTAMVNNMWPLRIASISKNVAQK